ncbi:hypothetical protein GCM10010345_89060 [Streptomyces canarius]|uniref:ANTAR domain-containing protein n=1 Tax=Streptomyces canarius TaxID=285453 RepID=A0ABQ3DBW6_9ACTN|nr:hypothetical protein GCM10010345_89060 [Streptomyces canarius]
MEGTGSIGPVLARRMPAQDVERREPALPDRTDRRRRGTSDPLAARNAARAVRARTRGGDAEDAVAQAIRITLRQSRAAESEASFAAHRVLLGPSDLASPQPGGDRQANAALRYRGVRET